MDLKEKYRAAVRTKERALALYMWSQKFEGNYLRFAEVWDAYDKAVINLESLRKEMLSRKIFTY